MHLNHRRPWLGHTIEKWVNHKSSLHCWHGPFLIQQPQAGCNWVINLISLIKWEYKHKIPSSKKKNPATITDDAKSEAFFSSNAPSVPVVHFQTINFDSPRGGISLVTEKGVLTTSRLLVQKAIPSDSGMINLSNSLSLPTFRCARWCRWALVLLNDKLWQITGTRRHRARQ